MSHSVEGTRKPGAAVPAAAAAGAGRTDLDRDAVCFVADREPAIRRSISLELDELGIQVFRFDNAGIMIEAALRRRPDLIFLDFGVAASDGASAIGALAAARIDCPVQLMSALNPALVEKVRRSGEQQGLAMLPVLYKPFRHTTIRQIVDGLGLRRDFLATHRLALSQVLEQRWL